jgi:hypothetical protein
MMSVMACSQQVGPASRLAKIEIFGENGELRKITAFALVGFSAAWILLAYSEYCAHHAISPVQALFLILCPPSIASMVLEHASFWEVIIVWLFIAVMNAVLYGCIGLLVVVLPSRQR